jgi:Fe-S-cluster containining protein
MSSTVFALSIHADYQCRHSGACCSADWDVPVELPVYRSLDAAVSAGRLRVAPPDAPLAPFSVGPDLPEGAAAILERTDAGGCVFFERESRLCIVHRDLGETALPATCRHFPRLAVRDRRGTFITLSHFCPTAASMLFRDAAVEIVEAPAAFPPADYDGLVVADDDLPPLLHPRMLMEEADYSAWERHMVSRCSDVTRSPESVIATLTRDAASLRSWRPGERPLRDAIARLGAPGADARPHGALDRSLRFHAEAMAAVPDDLRPPPDEDGLLQAYRTLVRPEWERFRAPLDRYVAAKAFASWTAYQGRGIATIVRGLDAALALVRVEAARQCRDAARPLDRDLLLEAFRSADFILNHLAVGEALAEAWGQAEPRTTHLGPLYGARREF